MTVRPILFFIAFLCLTLSSSFALAQQDVAQERKSPYFKATPRAASAVLMKQGQALIHLWGVEPVGSGDPIFGLKARTALENAIQGDAVTCEIKDKDRQQVFALCKNVEGVDLALSMIGRGYAVVDRSVIYGTDFETSYVQAETQAQNQEIGIWKAQSSEAGVPAKASGNADEDSLINVLGLSFLGIILIGFGVLTVIIMRGFQKVINAQNDNVSMMARERKLRQKEREVVIAMLDSELKTNKSKIDAYIVIYEETLAELNNPAKNPRYQKTGDIVQTQPALSRAIFDKNADKLDILGKKLASELIHFYARIKTNPDYENIEPDTDIHVVIKIVEDALDNARRLNSLADFLIESFEESPIELEDDSDHNGDDPTVLKAA